jgi:hypothetical protein
VDERGNDAQLGGACAVLFPIDWPEVVVDGVTGFVCETLRDKDGDIPRVRGLDSRACRVHVKRRFSPSAMTDGYERAYATVLGAGQSVESDLSLPADSAR